MASSVDAKLLRATKFPPEFNQKVDMQKVNLQVMKKWIASKISEILGSEDDVVTELCFNLIEGSRYPDIKSMQIQLTGFLDKDTAPFCKDLWNLCLSAQSNPQGVPKELLEAKKLELIQEKIDADKAAEESRIRREAQERRDRELSDIRDRERRERGFRGGRGDNWRGGGRRGGDRAFGGRGRALSPPRRERDSYYSNRDRYVPQGRRGSRQEFRRGRSSSRSASPDSRDSASRSRSPSTASDRSRRASLRSPTPPRRHSRGRRSPPRYRNSAKRDRSPGRARDYRGRRDGRRRNTSSPDSVSRSGSSRSRSPAPKRRRYSDSSSRSRSPPRRDVRRLSRSRSSSYSRSRSRSPRRRPVRELISRSPSPNRRGRLRRSPTRSPTPSESPEDTRRWRQKSPRRSREDVPSRKRSYSANSPRTRDRSADVSEDEDRPQSPRHHAASTADETKTPQQRANELREKLLKERIKKMRSTTSRDNVKG
ncbi:hypothetical protein F4776DRAFT_613325 [Hypoxylon sp. NC0597]|nr:hypothetical protein F4776DRAFT_613325 [Hypoxylon sp. NC0597]